MKKQIRHRRFFRFSVSMMEQETGKNTDVGLALFCLALVLTFLPIVKTFLRGIAHCTPPFGTPQSLGSSLLHGRLFQASYRRWNLDHLLFLPMSVSSCHLPSLLFTVEGSPPHPRDAPLTIFYSSSYLSQSPSSLFYSSLHTWHSGHSLL